MKWNDASIKVLNIILLKLFWFFLAVNSVQQVQVYKINIGLYWLDVLENRFKNNGLTRCF